ncbi:ATP-dependent sacrificial sulfur transferase LarE [Roseisolibacter agri]|nr:ATP-dependent sacrificial sulfur transferase LarE [Roseisolibacter agri]
MAWLREHGPVLLGFSGGVDSAYLASVAVEVLGAGSVLAVIGRSASYPEAQWRAAREVAALCGVPVQEVATHELEDPDYVANPSDRCFFCKRELWSRLAPLADARGMLLIDGTNADDLTDWRPGARAAADHAVRSPLAELEFTKADIRWLSRRRGLPTADQPSAPCLASRLPYGTPVTTARLSQVERAESALRAVGIPGDLRVRHHGAIARVELTPDVIEAWSSAERLEVLREAVVSAGFARVVVDLRGFRSGSLNVLGGIVAG